MNNVRRKAYIALRHQAELSSKSQKYPEIRIELWTGGWQMKDAVPCMLLANWIIGLDEVTLYSLLLNNETECGEPSKTFLNY